MGKEAQIVAPSRIIEDFNNSIGAKPIEYMLGDEVADQHLRIRKGQFNIVLGHPSTGKTTWLIWFLYQMAFKHKLKSKLYSGENDVNEIYTQLVQCFTGKNYWEITQEEAGLASEFILEYFQFIEDTRIYTAEELFHEFEDLDTDICLIDPHNSVKVPLGRNWYEYSVELGMEIRAFCKRTKKTVFLAAHPVTTAQRNLHKDGDFEGMLRPPIGPDMEGGGTWKNKADNLWIVHRYISHPQKWKQTQIIVEKIRYQDSGVKPTFIDSPLIFKRDKSGDFKLGDFETYEEKLEKTPF